MKVKIIAANKTAKFGRSPSFTLSNRIFRLAWSILWLLAARWTPPSWSPWRIFLLNIFGAKISRDAAVASSARIWFPGHLEIGPWSTLGPGVECYNMAQISIGTRSVISQRAFLCSGTHDTSDPTFQLVARPIKIGDNVWIAAEAFVGPGVTVGNDAVVAARCCVFSNLKEGGIYRGNPATLVRLREIR